MTETNFLILIASLVGLTAIITLIGIALSIATWRINRQTQKTLEEMQEKRKKQRSYDR